MPAPLTEKQQIAAGLQEEGRVPETGQRPRSQSPHRVLDRS
jgi:hypothetical protein